MITRRLLVAAAATVVLCGPLAAQGRDPLAIVKSIYDPKDRHGVGAALQVRARSRVGLSRALATAWRRVDADTPKGDLPPPGFDITTNSQGMDVARADVRIEREDARTATVVAALTPGHPWVRKSDDENVIRYDFVREDGQWKIDNVRSRNGDKIWTIRQILGDSLKR